MPRSEEELYLDLRTQLQTLGYFRPGTAGYLVKGTLLTIGFVASHIAVFRATSWWGTALWVWVLAHMSVQVAYISHDAGHGAITKRPWLADLIGHAGMTVACCFSYSWWKLSHGSHHQHVNMEGNDLALKYSLTFAMCENDTRRRSGWRRTLLQYQAYYIWCLFPLYHFAMIVDGFIHVVRHPRETRADQLGLLIAAVVWGVYPSLIAGPGRALAVWFGVSAIGSIYIAVTFTVHHIGKKTLAPSEPLSRFHHCVDATRTLRTWRIFDFYYSGLNYHIEHHLYPNVPHWRYYRMRGVVREFCLAHGFPYREEGFCQAFANLFRALKRIGHATGDGDAPVGTLTEPL